MTEAFKLLQKEILDVQLIISGDGNLKHCFEIANPYWSKIVFYRVYPQRTTYAIADLDITPSLHDEFGYVALEMMMNKLPVSAGCSRGLKESIDDGKYGILVDMNNDDRIIRLKNIVIDCLTRTENHKNTMNLVDYGLNKNIRWIFLKKE